MILSDNELVSRVKNYDDHYAFSQLVKKYQSPLRLFLRRLLSGDEGRADDVAQETMLMAYRKIDRFEGKSNFATWLFAIGKNQFLIEIRKQKKSFTWEEEVSIPSLNAKMDIEEAMKVLRPIEKAAITMCYFEDLTHEDVATILEIPLGTLKSHIKSSKEKLQAALKGYKENPSAGERL